jgi:HEAT repeat protein
MTRWMPLAAGVLCAALFGCGGGTDNSTATAPSTPAAPKTAAATLMLPDLQPVPAMTAEAAPDESTVDVQARAVFERWVAAASDNDPEAWTKAEQEMQAVGAAAVPALVAVLEGEAPLAREMAVMFLAQLGPQAEPAASALAKLLDDESPLVRVNAAGALTTFETSPPAAATTLLDLLSDADPNIRTTAAGCLGNIAELPPAALAKLMTCLDDPIASVRAASATTLSRAGAKAAAALPKLERLKADEDETVRQAATVAARLVDPANRPAGDAVPAGATAPSVE